MSSFDILVSSALGGTGALALSLLASALPRLRLATRRALVVAGLLGAVLAPAVAVVAPSLGLGLRPASVTRIAGMPTAPSATGAEAASIGVPSVVGDAGRREAAHESSFAQDPFPATATPRVTALPLRILVPTIWLAGAATGLLGLGIGLHRLRRLRRSLVVPGDLRLEGLFVSDALRVPATIGFLAPVVAIPRGLARDLSDEDLAAVRRHEGSHVLRRDPLAGLLGRLARALHWPNPLAHLAGRRLEVLSEALADAEAVRATPEKAPRYAACLVRIAERVVGERAEAGVAGMLGRRLSLTRRIEALLDPRGPGDPRPTARGRLGVVALGCGSIVLAACCCRAPTPPPQAPCAIVPGPAPSVIGFSPRDVRNDASTGVAFQTFTDGFLQANADPTLRGKIAVLFRPGTRLDPASIFVGGNPALGIDLAAFQVLQFIPGTGNIPLIPAPGGVEVRKDAILFTPAHLPLADGQYSIGVFAKVRGIDGTALAEAPVFLSFIVGSADTLEPIVVTSLPVNGARGVGAGADGRLWTGPKSPDIVIRFSESISSETISTSTIQVVDAGAFMPAGGAPPAIRPAPGFPKLKSLSDPAWLPSSGHEVVWRPDPAMGGLPFGSRVRVTVVGSDGGANATHVKDRSGNALPTSYVFEFETLAPPNLPDPPGR